MTTITGKIAAVNALHPSMHGQTVTGEFFGRDALVTLVRVRTGAVFPIDNETAVFINGKTAVQERAFNLADVLHKEHKVNASLTFDSDEEETAFLLFTGKRDGETVLIDVYADRYEVKTTNAKQNDGDGAPQNQRQIKGYDTLIKWVKSRI